MTVAKPVHFQVLTPPWTSASNPAPQQGPVLGRGEGWAFHHAACSRGGARDCCYYRYRYQVSLKPWSHVSAPVVPAHSISQAIPSVQHSHSKTFSFLRRSVLLRPPPSLPLFSFYPSLKGTCSFCASPNFTSHLASNTSTTPFRNVC